MTDGRTYRVDLAVGPYGWTVTDLDAPGYGLADPLVVGWAIADGTQRPGQPDAMVAQFSVIVPTTAALRVGVGDLVTIAVTFGPVDKPLPDAAFIGRVQAGDSAPHKRGMIYRFICADLTTDLLGYDVGADPYPPQGVNIRIPALIAAAGLVASDFATDPAAQYALLLIDGDPDPSAENLRDTLVTVWDSVAYPAQDPLRGSVFYRAILAPAPCVGGAVSSMGIPWRWAIDVIPDTYIPTGAAPLPGQFGAYWPPPAAYGVWFDPDDRAAGVIDACYVDYDATWSAILPAVVNRAAVTWATTATLNDPNAPRVPKVTYVVEDSPPPGQAPTTATRATAILGVGDSGGTTELAITAAQNLGHMMVPPPQNRAGWSPDTFTWLLYADDVGLSDFPTIFPAHYATGQPTPRPQRTACYVRPIVVTGLPTSNNPADPASDMVAGQLSAVTLTIEAGRPRVDLTLLPTIPAAGDPGTINSWDVTPGTWDQQVGVWDDLVPGYPSFRWNDRGLVGVTWDQLYPQPWNLYRLARGAA